MKIICVGWNYRKHCKELGGDTTPTIPTIFLKPETALLKDNKPVYIPDFTDRLEYELEVTVKINRLGKGIAEKFANRYYAEVGLGIDFTARDLQNQCKENGAPWEIAKAFDNSAALSRFIPLAELNKDIHDLHFHLLKNGQVQQQGYSGDMLFKIDEIIAYISQFFTFKEGDLIYTGTPAGVSALQIGDNLTGFLEDREMFSINIK